LRDGCLATLRALGQAVSTQLTTSADDTWTLHLKFGANAARLSFEVGTTRTHLSYPLAAGLIEQARHAPTPWLLFAPYVPGPIGRHLASQHVSYVDTAGNCHIELGLRLIAHVEGKRAVREARSRIRGVASHQLLFALLAEPDLVHAPARTIALAAGIGKTAALEQIGRLHMEDMLDHFPGAGLFRERELLDRWLNAYTDVVRPSWLLARFRPELTDPLALDALIERVCENREWAFGGAAAAHRMLAFDRGTQTVLHLTEVPVDLLEQLQAVRAPDGPLTILRTPGALAYQGIKPHLAHPLLVYAELLTCAQPSAAGVAGVAGAGVAGAGVAGAANEIRDQFFARVSVADGTI